jgi:hypothetical protein
MTNGTTLLGPVRTWWRRAAPAAERPTRIFQMGQERRPRVPADYLSLYTYLEHRFASIVVLTFEQMEPLLGFARPASASPERDWWTALPCVRAGTLKHGSKQGARPHRISPPEPSPSSAVIDEARDSARRSGWRDLLFSSSGRASSPPWNTWRGPQGSTLSRYG